MQYVTLTLEAVGAGVQETLMESEDIAWADTCDGAANFNGKCNTNGYNEHYAPVTLTHSNRISL